MSRREFFRGDFVRYTRYARLFEKGDLKYVILDLLLDKPRHGYEIIRELQERFHGLYTPSAGSVYPTLQLLEDMGYVKSSEQDGKKVYTILDAGKQFMTERQDTVSRIKVHMRDCCGPDWEETRETSRAFRDAFRDLADLMRGIHWNEEKLSKVKEIINRARKDIENIL